MIGIGVGVRLRFGTHVVVLPDSGAAIVTDAGDYIITDGGDWIITD